MLSTVVAEYPDQAWQGCDQEREGLESKLEDGKVLYFPLLRFDLSPDEQRFLSERWSDGKAKNISLRGQGDRAELRGCQGEEADLVALRSMIGRFADCAEALARRIFPLYENALRRGFTSFRPHAVSGRQTSWRKDDTRLHVDAFPSNPTGGRRLLRVFTNVHPNEEPRVWRVGEPFNELARRFLPQVGHYSAGGAKLMKALGITKSLRTEYDHIMLQLHDLGKCDRAYQEESTQRVIEFPPGSTWVTFSDQVQHAVTSGQFLLEQTFYLETQDLADPATAPLRVLERMTGKSLV